MHMDRSEFLEALVILNERLDLMATQADVEALVTVVEQIASDLEIAKATLQAEIDSISGANPSLDLSKLQAALAPLDSSVQALGALKPDPPAPVVAAPPPDAVPPVAPADPGAPDPAPAPEPAPPQVGPSVGPTGG